MSGIYLYFFFYSVKGKETFTVSEFVKDRGTYSLPCRISTISSFKTQGILLFQKVFFPFFSEYPGFKRVKRFSRISQSQHTLLYFFFVFVLFLLILLNSRRLTKKLAKFQETSSTITNLFQVQDCLANTSLSFRDLFPPRMTLMKMRNENTGIFALT